MVTNEKVLKKHKGALLSRTDSHRRKQVYKTCRLAPQPLDYVCCGGGI